MDQWCMLSVDRVVSPGEFLESVLETSSGAPLHSEQEFLEFLAEFIMERYEGSPYSELKSISGVSMGRPSRTKRHYRRLFDSSGAPTQDFLTFASESLALWIEKTLAGALYAEGGLPHAADPAYDVLSIVKDGSDTRLRITQVKATENNLQGNASAAIAKFELLEQGYYDSELSARLELMQIRTDSPPGVDTKELLYDPERRYRVVVVHAEDRSGFSILTQYQAKIPGRIERRSAYLIKVEWPHFWSALSRKVYERLG